MPKERIYGRHGEAAPNLDIVVSWGKGDIVYASEENDGAVFVGLVPQESSEATLAGSYDRTSINRLIRTLRRARDGAFGADA